MNEIFVLCMRREMFAMNKYSFQAGAGSAEIVLPETFFPADSLYGVHDNPHVRILLLDAGERAALVAVELVNVPGDCIEIMRRSICEITGTPCENISIHVPPAITTPHAPGGGPNPNGPGMDPDAAEKRRIYTEAVTEAAAKAARDAAASFCEAQYAVVEGFCDVNSNRDIESKDGWWIGINRAGLSNKNMEILRVEKRDGSPLGFLISYGIKPCAIDMADPKNPLRKVCTDVPGVACRRMEEEFGVPCLFFMSAAGDQVPREQAVYDEVQEDGTLRHVDLGIEKGYEIVERLGQEMGETAVAIAKKEAESVKESSITAASGITMAKTMNRIERPNGPVRSAEFSTTGQIELDAGVICLGDLAFVAVKPEVNAQTEKELKEASPYAHTLLMSMVNGGMKYMPDLLGYERVSWEVLSSMCMPGTAEKWVSRVTDLLHEVKEEKKEPEITLVAEPDAEGQWMSRVAVAFEDEAPDADPLTVVGRTIVGRHRDGKVITLDLSKDDREASVIPHPEHKAGAGKKDRPGGEGPEGAPNQGGERKKPKGPKGPKGGAKRRPLRAEVTVPGYHAPIPSGKVIQPVIDDFVQHEYKKIPYSLFAPEVKEGEKVPLVVFIPDAGSNGSDPLLALAQGIGGVCWAAPEEQAKHPAYVLAIQIPAEIYLTTDEYTVAPEFETIWELISRIADECQVDRDRIYCTGQSQGCMAFCEMNLEHPDFFAASLLVSGHWDVERMKTLKDKKFLFGLSSGGRGEFPCFNALTDYYASAGVDLAKVHLNFRYGWEVNEETVRDAIGEPGARQMAYVIFDEETAFPDDGKERPSILHHQRGWELTYQLEAVRDWLFAQHR